MRRAVMLGLLAAALGLAQPVVSAVQNNYSYIPPGVPQYGIAQGSIFVVFGTGLANTSTGLQSIPLRTTVEGVSAAVTVGGVTRAAILYYVTPSQIAGILPSNTPNGAGTIVVTNNGRASAPAPITVVQSAFGTLTLDGSGGGPAAVFDAANQFLSPTNATRPGEVIVFYGTGVGPTPGDETGTQTQTNLTAVPIVVEIGGKPAQVLYRGRTVFPGLDQINVVVPAGVGPGCGVSVAVSSGTMVGNFTTIPVAASGNTCPTEGGDDGLVITDAEFNRWSAAGQYSTGSEIGVLVGPVGKHSPLCRVKPHQARFVWVERATIVWRVCSLGLCLSRGVDQDSKFLVVGEPCEPNVASFSRREVEPADGGADYCPA